MSTKTGEDQFDRSGHPDLRSCCGAKCPSGAKLGCYRMENSTGWPSEADRVDRPGEPDHAGSGNVGLWDIATIDEIVAKQRKATLAACSSKSYRCHDGTSALPSEAESWHSSALGQLRTRAGASYPAHVIKPKSQKRTRPNVQVLQRTNVELSTMPNTRLHDRSVCPELLHRR